MSQLPATISTPHRKAVEDFQALINREPAAGIVRINKMAGNSKYLPIAEVERLLDEFFPGWTTTAFSWQVIANEIVGSLELVVHHPTTGAEMRRVGAAAVMIQTRSGQAPTVDNKIINTLSKDMPHLKAECLKNAAKSLGTIFGRNLNRDAEDEYQPLTEQVAQLEADVQRALELLKTAKVSDDTRDKIVRRIRKANPKELARAIEFLVSKQ